jgi:hypothetical protein
MFCSAACRTAVSAAKSVGQRREGEKEAKLSTVRSALREWVLTDQKIDPKRWIADKAGVTLNWLTRAAHWGEVKVPKSPEGS